MDDWIMAKSTTKSEMDDRWAIADRVIIECFWGDYNLTAEQLLSRLE
jgi:hypothetical protein